MEGVSLLEILIWVTLSAQILPILKSQQTYPFHKLFLNSLTTFAPCTLFLVCMICFSFLKTLCNGHHFEFLINTKHANFFKDQDAFQKCLLSNGVVVSDKNIKGPM